MQSKGLTKAEFIAEYRVFLQKVQKGLSKEKQIELPLLHDFTPGLYLRRILMPKGAWVIGKTHKTEHFNIILSGSANVMIDGEVKFIKAPEVFISKPGVKKVLFILEEMIWATTHATKETDPQKLEKECICSEEEENAIINESKKYLGVL